MMRVRVLLLIAVMGLMTSPLSAKGPAAGKPDEVSRVASLIDRRIQAAWSDAEITPAPRCGDSEYCRRVYLAIAGRIPFVAEVRDFLEDERPNKRRLLVDKLLESNAYVSNFAVYWRQVLIPEISTDPRTRFFASAFEDWLEFKLLGQKTRMDLLVHELLTSQMNSQVVRQGAPTPVAFYRSKENKPENIAAATSRMFLGIRLECAQCHEHPFDSWSQKQFWSFAAFFARAPRSGNNNLLTQIRNSFDRRSIMIPDTEIRVSATLLDGTSPKRKSGQTARQALADWIVARDNPYFSKAIVNRMWGHLFGNGFVSPIDDMSTTNTPTHPKLLEELGKEFVAHDFDLKFLIRAILASDSYQRSSRQTHESNRDGQLFSRMVPQPMTAEQLMRSLSVALGKPELGQFSNRVLATPNQLMELFADGSELPSERSATILQSLALMNGDVISDATTVGKGATLTAVTEAPWMNDETRVKTLFLACLSRPPRDDELSKMTNYVKRKQKKERDQAFSDVLWMLVNSSEFLLNN